MLFREIIAVYCENHTEHINTLCGQNAESLMLTQVVYILTSVLQSVNERAFGTHFAREEQ
jgi:hypothetical protein